MNMSRTEFDAINRALKPAAPGSVALLIMSILFLAFVHLSARGYVIGIAVAVLSATATVLIFYSLHLARHMAATGQIDESR